MQDIRVRNCLVDIFWFVGDESFCNDRCDLPVDEGTAQLFLGAFILENNFSYRSIHTGVIFIHS
jgi:hypothetical protein